MSRHVFLLLFALAMVACNRNKLQPEEAKQKLADYYNENPRELLGTIAFEAVIKDKDSGYNKILFRHYIGAGLLTLKEKRMVSDTPVYVYQVTEANYSYILKTTRSRSGYPVFVVKTFDYYIDQVTDITYSPDRQEAAVKYNLSIRNLTPFGKDVADLDHKRFLQGFFRFVNNQWEFEKTEPDLDQY